MKVEGDCPFCFRIAGLGNVQEEGNTIASFPPLNPVTPGHRLFVPMNHVEWWMRVGGEDAATRAADCVRAAVDYANRHSIQQFNLITSSGRNATQSVPHLHIHLVPRIAGDRLVLPWTGQK